MTSSSGGASDLYAVLEIDRNATAAQIKKAYRRLALKWHPDKNGNDTESNEKFKAISAAYDVLGDTQRRKQYDTSGRIDNRQAEDLNPYEVFEKAFAGYEMEELVGDDMILRLQAKLFHGNRRISVVPTCLYRSSTCFRIAVRSKAFSLYPISGVLMTAVGLNGLRSCNGRFRSFKDRSDQIGFNSALILIGGSLFFYLSRQPIIQVDILRGTIHAGGLPLWRFDRLPYYHTVERGKIKLETIEAEEQAGNTIHNLIRMNRPLRLVAMTGKNILMSRPQVCCCMPALKFLHKVFTMREKTIHRRSPLSFYQALLCFLNWLDAVNAEEQRKQAIASFAVGSAVVVGAAVGPLMEKVEALAKSSNYVVSTLLQSGFAVVTSWFARHACKYLMQVLMVEEVEIRPPKFGPFFPKQCRGEDFLSFTRGKAGPSGQGHTAPKK